MLRFIHVELSVSGTLYAQDALSDRWSWFLMMPVHEAMQ